MPGQPETVWLAQQGIETVCYGLPRQNFGPNCCQCLSLRRLKMQERQNAGYDSKLQNAVCLFAHYPDSTWLQFFTVPQNSMQTTNSRLYSIRVFQRWCISSLGSLVRRSPTASIMSVSLPEVKYSEEMYYADTLLLRPTSFATPPLRRLSVARNWQKTLKGFTR